MNFIGEVYQSLLSWCHSEVLMNLIEISRGTEPTECIYYLIGFDRLAYRMLAGEAGESQPWLST